MNVRMWFCVQIAARPRRRCPALIVGRLLVNRVVEEASNAHLRSASARPTATRARPRSPARPGAHARPDPTRTGAAGLTGGSSRSDRWREPIRATPCARLVGCELAELRDRVTDESRDVHL